MDAEAHLTPRARALVAAFRLIHGPDKHNQYRYWALQDDRQYEPHVSAQAIIAEMAPHVLTYLDQRRDKAK